MKCCTECYVECIQIFVTFYLRVNKKFDSKMTVFESKCLFRRDNMRPRLAAVEKRLCILL